jgi:LysM repeat protein
MKQIIPFEKDILFKTKIGELTSISLDNDLILKGEDIVTGNFYIKGTYKMISSSTNEEEYSYKIPCEIQISDTYDTYDCTIDIDDFSYEIKNDDTLCVKISVLLDNLVKKEIEVKEERKEEKLIDMTDQLPIKEELEQEKPETKKIEELVVDERNIDPVNVFNDIKSDIISDTDERYLTYKVYTVQEEDTIEKICTKYKVSVDQIKDYNDFDNLTTGLKLLIPNSND